MRCCIDLICLSFASFFAHFPLPKRSKISMKSARPWAQSWIASMVETAATVDVEDVPAAGKNSRSSAGRHVGAAS